MPPDQTVPFPQLLPITHPESQNTDRTIPLQSFSNSYDTNYRPEMNQEANRGSNQSWHQQLGYGLISRSLSLIPKLGEAVGSLYGTGAAIADSDMTKIWDNPINNMFENMDESIKEHLPVYQTSKAQNSGLLGKMMTTSFWGSDGFDAAAYGLAFAIPGKAIGAATEAIGAGLNTLSETSKVAKAITQGAEYIGFNAHRANLVLASTFNTVGESSSEAYQTQHEVQAILDEKVKQGLMTSQQAKQKAGEAATRTFAANMAVLAIPEFIENTLVHGGWDQMQKQIRSSVFANAGKVGEELSLKESLLKKAGTGILTEGFWEENVQNAIQSYEDNAAQSGNYDKNYVKEIGTNMANGVVSFFKAFLPGQQTSKETEQATSIFLGGLIGGAMGAYGAKRENTANKKVAEEAKNVYNDLVNVVGPASIALMREQVGSILKKDGTRKVPLSGKDIDVSNYELDDQGNTIIDQQALHNKTTNQLNNKFFWDNHMNSLYTNDPSQFELNKQEALMSYAYNLASHKNQYTSDEIQAHLDKVAETGDNEAQDLGVPTFIKQNMQQVKDYVNAINAITIKRGSAKIDHTNVTKSKFNEFVSKAEFYLTAKQKALENTLPQATTQQGKDSITKLLEDNKEQLRILNDELPQLKKEYEKSITDPSTRMQEFNTLVTNKSKTPEQTERQRELEFNIREDHFINGSWTDSENSRTLPMGASNTTLAQTRLGSRDMYNQEVGKTAIAVSRIKENLTKPELFDDEGFPDLLAADEYSNNITALSKDNQDEIMNLKAPIEGRLTKQHRQLSAQLAQTHSVLSVVGQLSDESLVDSTDPYSVKDLIVSKMPSEAHTNAVIEGLNKQGIPIDDTTLHTSDFIEQNRDRLNAVASYTSNEALQQAHNLQSIDNAFDKVQHPSGTGPFASRFTSYANSTNREEWLENDYFNTAIKKPIQSLIDEYNEDLISGLREFTKEQVVNDRINTLKAVVASYTNRNNKSTLDEAKYLLQFLSEDVYPYVVENINRRAAIHRDINNEHVGSLLESLGLTGNVNLSMKPLLEEAIGKDKLVELLDKVYDQALEVHSFDAIGVLFDNVKKVVSKDLLDRITNNLLTYRKSVADMLLNELPSHMEKLRNTLLRTNGLELRTVFNSHSIIDVLFQNSNSVPDFVTKFLYDHDITSLAKVARNSSEITKEEQKIILKLYDAYSTIIGVNSLELQLQNNYDYSKLLEAKLKFTSSDYVPSLQQNIALNQGLDFLFKDVKASNFNEWLLVQGIGGSGKTFLMAGTLLNLYQELSGEAPKILAFSKEVLTSNNINEALNTTIKGTFDRFRASSIEDISKQDLIILDEVFTFSNTEIYEIYQKVSEASKLKGKTIKIIALGDPSQTTAEIDPIVAKGQEINMSIPLTTSYRTNVSSIAVFNSNYQLKSSEPQHPTGLANVSVDEAINSPSSATGVIGMNREQLASILSTNSTRTRVLIVSSEADKAANEKKFPGVDVKLVRESQGYQWDEVYILLDPSRLGNDQFTINRGLYTAYSRAKSLLVIADAGVENSEPNTNMDSDIAQSSELVTAARYFGENIGQAKIAQDILAGVPTFSPEQVMEEEVVPENDPITEENIVVSSSYAETDPNDIPEPTPTTRIVSPHTFTYPTNNSLIGRSDGQGGYLYDVSPGSTAHIVRAVGAKNKSTTGDEYFVMVESPHKPGNFVVVSVLGQADFEGSSGDYFNNIIKNRSTSVVDYSHVIKRGYTPFEKGINSYSLGTVTIGEFKTLKALRSENYTSNKTSLMPGAKDVIEDAIIRFYLSFYGPIENGASVDQTNIPSEKWVKSTKTAAGKITFSVDWKAIGKKIQMVIPTRKDPKAGIFGYRKGDNNPRFGPQYGVPYLSIKPDYEGSDATNRNFPILIKFQPIPFNRDSQQYGPIRKLYNAVATIERVTGFELGQDEFTRLVRQYASDNFHVGKEVSKYSENQTHHFIERNSTIESTDDVELDDALQTIVPLIWGAKESTKYFSTEEAAKQYIEDNGVPYNKTEFHSVNGQLVVGVEANKDGSRFTLRVPIDHNQDGETQSYKEHIMWEGEGPAQEKLNSLARANLTIGREQLREVTKKVVNKEVTKNTRAESILYDSEQTSKRKAYTDYDSLFKDEDVIKLLGEEKIDRLRRQGEYTKILDAMEEAFMKRDNLSKVDARSLAYSWVSVFTAQPITSEMLGNIVGDHAFDENGNHNVDGTSLRQPLQLHTLNKTGVNDLGQDLSNSANRAKLSSSVQHNFVAMQHTSLPFSTPISVSTEEVPEIVNPSEKIHVGKLVDKLDTIKSTGIEALDRVVDLLKKLKSILKNIDIFRFPQGIPVKMKDGSIQNSTTHLSTERLDNGEVFVATGYQLGDLNKHRGQQITFLHETLHVVTASALDQGLMDARKKLDTKESEFYKKIISIKKRFDAAVKSKVNPETGAKYKTSEIYQTTESKLDAKEFIANLSNPEFIKMAQEIPLLPKSKSESIFKSILRAIVDLFKSFIGTNPSVYEVAITTLEDYYNILTKTGESLPLIVKMDTIAAKETINNFIAGVTTSLNTSDEFDFDSLREQVIQSYSHIFDTNSLPENFGDSFKLRLKPVFESLDIVEQASIIQKATNTSNSSSYAYTNLPQTKTIVSPGAIASTKGVANLVDRAFSDITFGDDEIEKGEKNLLRTFIIKATGDYSNLLRRLTDAINDPLNFTSLIYSEILSTKDKDEIRKITNLKTDKDAMLAFYDTSIGQSVRKVLGIINSRMSDVEFITSNAEDRTAIRYAIAKNFVSNFFKANLDKDKGLAVPFDSEHPNNLIQDRREVIANLRSYLAPKNILLPSGLTLRDAGIKLNEYYQEVQDLNALGRLTKEQTRRKSTLLSDLIPPIEDEQAALTALKERDSQSGDFILDAIINDIYPKYSLDTEEQIEIAKELADLVDAEYVTRDQADNDIEETANISEHIKTYSKSPELTLSESLKDYLSFVSIGDKIISSGLAFIKTMQLATTLDWTQEIMGEGHNILKQLIARRDNNSYLSSLDETIINNMINTINIALGTNFTDTISLDFGSISLGIGSTRTATNVLVYKAFKTTGIVDDKGKQSGMFKTLEELDNMKGLSGITIETSSNYTSTSNLYNWLKTKHPELTIPQFNRLFTKSEAINNVRALMNTMGSMKETELYIGHRSNKDGLRMSLQKSKAAGISFSMKDTIRYSLINMYDKEQLSSFSDTFLNFKIKGTSMEQFSNGSYSQRELFVREFFSQIGFRSNANSILIKAAELPDIIEDIKGFLDRTKNLGEYDEYKVTVDDTQQEQFDEWLENEVAGNINRFAELLGKSDDLYRNPSVRDSKGGKYYVYHESSFAHDTLANLMDLHHDRTEGFQGGTGTSMTRKVPSFLRTNFFKHNIFVTGKVSNKLYAIGEYEGAKNDDNGAVTPYLRENMFFFFHRKFAQGFLDNVRQYGDKYTQFSYIPSDKPKHPMVRVGILSDKVNDKGTTKIKGAIEQALTQILNKSEYASKVDIVNYNTSINGDESRNIKPNKFRNFEIAEEAIKELNIPFNSENITKIANKIHEIMERQASSLLDELLSEDISLTFDQRTYTSLRKISNRINDKFKLPTSQFASETKKKDAKFKNKTEGVYTVNKAEILPAFDLFFKNNYVNGYFLNQLMMGDYSSYSSSADEIKRLAGVFGPGIKGLVDSTIGMRQNSRTLVLADTVQGKEDTREIFKELLFGGKDPEGEDEIKFEQLMKYFESKFESTDAQGFFLPKRQRELARGFERNWGLGAVHKPLYMGVHKYAVTDDAGKELYSTGVPVYAKYSAIELSDGLVSKFPLLGKLRRNAELMGIDEIIFKSGIKEGMPIVRNETGELYNDGNSFGFHDFINFDEVQLNTINTQWKSPPIINFDNNNFRLQHNPAADPNKQVSLFSQLVYFLNVYPDKLSNGEYETTQDAAKEVYQLVGELIKMGYDDFTSKVNDMAGLRSYLAKSFDGPGAERALDLINNGISVDFPLLEKRSIISLASGLEKSTVKIKLQGGKLVLQTAEGITKGQDESLFGPIEVADGTDGWKKAHTLSYKMETISDEHGKNRRILVAEAIVPSQLLTDEQLSALRQNKSIYVLPDAMGFRIPSTELHSAVPIRVVGIYSSKIANVVIMPKELVAIHGSDFDVDALFVVTKELFDVKESSTIDAEFLSKYMKGIKNILTKLDNSMEHATPEGITKLKYLKENIKKYAGLVSDEEDNSLPSSEQTRLNDAFKTYISTPQLSNLSRTFREIPKDLPDYNEARAKIDFGRKNDVYWSNSEDEWVSKSSTQAKAEKVGRTIKEFMQDNSAQESLVTDLLTIVLSLNENKKFNEIGATNTPVGYTANSKGQYELNRNFLDSINKNIDELQALNNTLQPELASFLASDIKNGLKNLKSIKQKYIKNRIMDTMLQVVSDSSNVYRMMSPISFEPLTNAIDKIPENLKPKTSYDPSNLGDEFKIYQALNAGVILTGAFANASKSFGYFARAGAEGRIKEYYDLQSSLKKTTNILEANQQILEIPEIYNTFIERYNQLTPEKLYSKDVTANGDQVDWLKTVENLQTKLKAQKINIHSESFNKIDTSPTLLKTLQFSIQLENGQTPLFDRLATMDARNEHSVTAVYDTLTNEAIDNLKRGDLVKARINTNTGSAVIGLVSIGTPMDVIVKILYQPILFQLSSGKINNVKSWINDIKKARESGGLNEDIIRASMESLSVTSDLDKGLHSTFQGLTPLKLKEKMSSSDFDSQLRALDIFMKGYKIGEDMRAASNFFNLIRQNDVFIEDILQLDDNLESSIGKPYNLPDGELGFRAVDDFSFPIPNMFESAPHIREAYKSHQGLVGLIEKHIKIHSIPLKDFSNQVYTKLSILKDDDNAQQKRAEIRRSLSWYLLSGQAAPKIASIDPEIVTKGDYSTTISPARVFSNRVTNNIWDVRQYAADNKIDNLFLRNISAIRDSFAVASIGFKTGVNMDSTDIRNIALGFKQLNRFSIVDEDVHPMLPPSANYINSLQDDLLWYVMINYGMNFSSSNYAAYIPSSMLKIIDNKYGIDLDRISNLVENKDQEIQLTNLKNHFTLSHILQNAAKLAYIDNAFINPVTKSEMVGEKRIPAVLSGVDILNFEEDGVPVTKPVYFDIRLSKTSSRNAEEKLNAAEYLRRSFGDKIEVYRRVFESNDNFYYQKVAKISDVFHMPFVDEKGNFKSYEVSHYFNPHKATLEYHFKDGANSVFTYNGMINSLKIGDEIYINPIYNADRTQRELVRITSIDKTLNKRDIPGYKVSYSKVNSISTEEVSSEVQSLVEEGKVKITCSK